MKSKIKTFAITTTGVVATAAGAGVAVPFIFGKNKPLKPFAQIELDNIINASNDMDLASIVNRLTGPTSENAKEAVKAFVKYVHDANQKQKGIFKQTSKTEDGVIKTTFLVNDNGNTSPNQNTTSPQSNSFEINEEDKTWSKNLIKSKKASFGIYVEFIDGKIYTIKTIDPNQLLPKASGLRELNEGHTTILKFITNLAVTDYKRDVIGNDGSLKPSTFDEDKLFSPTSFDDPSKLNEELSKQIKYLRENTNELEFFRDKRGSEANSTTANIIINFIGKHFELKFTGFKPNNAYSTVDEAYKMLNGARDNIKVDDLKNEDPHGMTWIGARMGDVFTNIHGNKYELLNGHWENFVYHARIKISNENDKDDVKTADLELKGFISEQDLITKTLFENSNPINAHIESKDLSNKKNTMIASEAAKLIFDAQGFKTFDLVLPNKKYKVDLELVGGPDDPDGKIVYRYIIKPDNKDKSYINASLSKELVGSFHIDGFKLPPTPTELQQQTKTFLDGLKQFKVPGQEKVFPSDAITETNKAKTEKLILEEYTKLVNKTQKNKRPVGQPIIHIISPDNDKGAIKISISYNYGNLIATTPIYVDGYKTTGQEVASKLKEDVDKVKLAILDQLPTIKQKLDLPKQNSWTIKNLNNLLEKAHQIPNAINNVERTYTVTRDEDKGMLNVKINFSLEGQTAFLEFNIIGFKTKEQSIQEKIDRDFAQLNNKTLQAKQSSINTFGKGDEVEIGDIQRLITDKTQFTATDGIKWKITTTSDKDATTLLLTIEISGNGNTTPKTANLKIENLLSQADFDSTKLNNAVIAKLNEIMHKNGDMSKTAKENKDNMPDAPVDVTAGKTTFKVTFKQDGVDAVAIDNYKGAIKFKYTATATGLHKTITDVKANLSGFKTTLTDEQKKDHVQAELDELAKKPQDSGESHTIPSAYTSDDAKTLLSKHINSYSTKEIKYEIISTGDGQVVAQLTYTFGKEVATQKITINGLMTNKDINTEDIAAIRNNTTSKKTITINQKDGFAALTTAEVLTTENALKFGIALPKDLKDVVVKWTHGALDKDGELTINLEFSKKDGNALTKEIKVEVNGINKTWLEYYINNFDIDWAKSDSLKAGDADKLASQRAKPGEGTVNDYYVKYKFSQWDVDNQKGEIKYKITFFGLPEYTDIEKTSKEITITGFGKQIDIPTAAQLNMVAQRDGKTYTLKNKNPMFAYIDKQTISVGETKGNITPHLKNGYLFAVSEKDKDGKDIVVGKNEITIQNVDIDQTSYNNVVKANNAQDYLDKLAKNIINVPNQKSHWAEEIGKSKESAPQYIIDAYNAQTDADKHSAGKPSFGIISTSKNKGTATIAVEYSFGNEKAQGIIIFGGFKTEDEDEQAKLDADKKQVVDKIVGNGTLNTKDNIVEVSHANKVAFPNIPPITLDGVNRVLPKGAQLPAAINNVIRKYKTIWDLDKGEFKVVLEFNYFGKQETYEFRITGFKTKTEIIQEKIDAVIANLDKTISAKNNTINTFKKDDTPSLKDINTLLKTSNQIIIDSSIATSIKVTSAKDASALTLEFTISSTNGGTPKTTIITINKLLSQADLDSNNLNDAVIAKLKAIMEAKGDKGGTATANKGKMPSTPVDITIGKTTFKVTFKQDGADAVAIDNYKGTIKFKYTATATGLNKTFTDIKADLSGFKTTLTDEQKKDRVQAELDELAKTSQDSEKSHTRPSAYTSDNAKALLSTHINSYSTKEIKYEIISTSDGQVVAQLTYTFGKEVATQKITINGLMTNKDINTEDIAAIRNNTTSKKTITINQKDGITALTTAEVLTPENAVKFGIELPKDLKDVVVKWTRGALDKDGKLTINLEFSKKDGNALTKEIEVEVNGINKTWLEYYINNFDIDWVKSDSLKAGDADKLASQRAKPGEGTVNNYYVQYKFSQWDVDNQKGEIKYKITFFAPLGDTNLEKTSKEITITGFGKQIDIPTPDEIGAGIGSRDGQHFTVADLSKLHPDWHIDRVSPAPLKNQGQTTGALVLYLQNGYLFKDQNGKGRNNTFVTITIDQTLYNNVIKADNAKKYLNNLAKNIINVPNQRDNLPNTVGAPDADAPKFIVTAFNAQTDAKKHSAGNPTFTIVSIDQENGTASIKIEYTFGAEKRESVIKFGGFKTTNEYEQEQLKEDKKQVVDKIVGNGTLNTKDNIVEVSHANKVALPNISPKTLDAVNRVLPKGAQLPAAINNIERTYKTTLDLDKGEIKVSLKFAYHGQEETYEFRITGFKTKTDIIQEKIDAVIANLDKTISAKNNTINTFKKDDTPSLKDINTLLKTSNQIIIDSSIATSIKVTSAKDASALTLEFTISSTNGGTPKTTTITIDNVLSQADFDSAKLNDAVVAKLKAIMEAKGDKGGTATANKGKMPLPSEVSDIKVGQTTFKVTFKQDGADAVAINDENGTIKFLYSATADGLNKTIKNASSTVSGFKTIDDLVKQAKAFFTMWKAGTHEVQNVKSVFPSNAENLPNINELAFNGLKYSVVTMGKATMPEGKPSISFKSIDNEKGEATLTFTYKYGTKSASSDFTFKGFQTNKEAKEKAQKYLDSLKTGIILDGDWDETLPSFAKSQAKVLGISDYLKTSYNNLVSKLSKDVKPFGDPTVVIKSGDDNKGILIVTIEYKYGTYTASADIDFKGFKTSGQDLQDKLEEDIQNVKDKVSENAKISQKAPYLPTHDKWTFTNVNELLDASNQIPQAINGVKRTFVVTRDGDSGIIKVKINFTLNNNSDSYEFSISGFKTDKQLKQQAQTFLNKLMSSGVNVPNQEDKLPSEAMNIKDTLKNMTNAFKGVWDKTSKADRAAGQPESIKWSKALNEKGEFTVTVVYKYGNEEATADVPFTGFLTNKQAKENLSAVMKSIVKGILLENISQILPSEAKQQKSDTLKAIKDSLNTNFAAFTHNVVPDIVLKSVDNDKGELTVNATYKFGKTTEAKFEFTFTGFQTNADVDALLSKDKDRINKEFSKNKPNNYTVKDEYYISSHTWTVTEINEMLAKIFNKTNKNIIPVANDNITRTVDAKMDRSTGTMTIEVTSELKGRSTSTSLDLEGFDNHEDYNKVTQKFLDELNKKELQVNGQEDLLPSEYKKTGDADAAIAMSNAYLAYVKSLSEKDRPKGKLSSKLKSIDDKTGKITFTQSYKNGNYTATKDVVYAGFQTHKILRDKTQGILDQLKNVMGTVKGHDNILPSDLKDDQFTDDIIAAYKEQAKKVSSIPKGVATIKLKAFNDEKGEATYTISYEYGDESATGEMTFNGFETNKKASEKAQAYLNTLKNISIKLDSVKDLFPTQSIASLDYTAPLKEAYNKLLESVEEEKKPDKKPSFTFSTWSNSKGTLTAAIHYIYGNEKAEIDILFIGYKTNADAKQIADEYLSSLSNTKIKVPDQKDILPSEGIKNDKDSIKKAIIEAYNEHYLTSSSSVEKPQGNPEFEIISTDDDSGTITVGITYKYGTIKTAVHNVDFTGYNTFVNWAIWKIHADNQAIKDKVGKSVGTTKFMSLVPEKDTWTIKDINDLMPKEHQLPQPTDSAITRTFSVTRDEATGTLKVRVSPNIKSVAGTWVEFTIEGFLSHTQLKNAAISFLEPLRQTGMKITWQTNETPAEAVANATNLNDKWPQLYKEIMFKKDPDIEKWLGQPKIEVNNLDFINGSIKVAITYTIGNDEVQIFTSIYGYKTNNQKLTDQLNADIDNVKKAVSSTSETVKTGSLLPNEKNWTITSLNKWLKDDNKIPAAINGVKRTYEVSISPEKGKIDVIIHFELNSLRDQYEISIIGFKTYDESRIQAQNYLDSIKSNEMNVGGQELILPSYVIDNQDDEASLKQAILAAYNKQVQQAKEENRPLGTPTLEIKSGNNDTGKLIVNFTYKYGEKWEASADLTLTGYITNKKAKERAEKYFNNSNITEVNVPGQENILPYDVFMYSPKGTSWSDRLQDQWEKFLANKGGEVPIGKPIMTWNNPNQFNNETGKITILVEYHYGSDVVKKKVAFTGFQTNKKAKEKLESLIKEKLANGWVNVPNYTAIVPSKVIGNNAHIAAIAKAIANVIGEKYLHHIEPKITVKDPNYWSGSLKATVIYKFGNYKVEKEFSVSGYITRDKAVRLVEDDHWAVNNYLVKDYAKNFMKRKQNDFPKQFIMYKSSAKEEWYKNHVGSWTKAEIEDLLTKLYGHASGKALIPKANKDLQRIYDVQMPLPGHWYIYIVIQSKAGKFERTTHLIVPATSGAAKPGKKLNNIISGEDQETTPSSNDKAINISFDHDNLEANTNDLIDIYK